MKTRLLLGFIICLSLSSCLEITEETSIKENGSGRFYTSMDMAQLVEMMQAMGGEEFEKRKNEKIDSSFYLASIVDTSRRLNVTEKKLFRAGKCQVKMDFSKKQFLLSMEFPFNSLQELQMINRGMTDGKISFSGLTQMAMGSKDKQKEEAGPELDQLLGIFNYSIENGLIGRSLNKEKYNRLVSDPKMAEMKQAAEMGIEIGYNTVYKLPRPAKKLDNPKAVLTDGRTTVTLKQNLMKLFSAPEDFAFSISY
jgi:hypothetical protein